MIIIAIEKLLAALPSAVIAAKLHALVVDGDAEAGRFLMRS